MRILHVVNELNACGNGIVNMAVDVAASQRLAGHEVAVAAPEGSLCKFLQASGVKHYPVGFRAEPRALIAAYRTFRGIIRAFDPDVVHCHTVTAFLVAKVCRLTSPYVLIAHVQNIHEKRSRLLAFADHCIAVSEAVSRDLQSWPGTGGRVTVLYNCTLGSPRVKWFARRSRANLRLQKPSIVTVAGLNERKNIDGLIAAFNLIADEQPAAHLYLVGDGPAREKFERLARESKARDRIHFEGFQADPTIYMKAADVFVLASRRESFGMVLHEARESGAAIVGTAVDGIPEALDNGEAGILVPPGDTAALAKAINGLLKDDRERARWRVAAKRNLERHSVAALTKKIEDVYLHTLRTSRRKSHAVPVIPDRIAAKTTSRQA